MQIDRYKGAWKRIHRFIGRVSFERVGEIRVLTAKIAPNTAPKSRIKLKTT